MTYNVLLFDYSSLGGLLRKMMKTLKDLTKNFICELYKSKNGCSRIMHCKSSA